MSEINKTIVKDVYSAFQRRDIPALLNCLSEDGHWFSIGPPQIIPTAGTRYGRKQVEEYLYTLEAIEEVKSFAPQEFIADGEKVVAVGEMQSRIKSKDILIKTPVAILSRSAREKLATSDRSAIRLPLLRHSQRNRDTQLKQPHSKP